MEGPRESHIEKLLCVGNLNEIFSIKDCYLPIIKNRIRTNSENIWSQLRKRNLHKRHEGCLLLLFLLERLLLTKLVLEIYFSLLVERRKNQASIC